MSSTYIVLSSYPVAPTAQDHVASSLGKSSSSRKLYRSVDGSDVVELRAIDDLAEIKDLETEWESQKAIVSRHLVGDVRRQILKFVEAPKDCGTRLPETGHIQLRYVEVKPPVYNAYRAWREETIFDVVRGAAEVEVFLAYHTLMSTHPGVMFVSGFEGELSSYEAVFKSDTYKDIVRQAGDRYITSGPSGLSTRIFRVADASHVTT